ncbi:MAG: hypothetical protein LBR79_03660 [Oscillospiraceae bacterium]|nr:hypothetical protein [Oscillospiraceae bacterium]
MYFLPAVGWEKVIKIKRFSHGTAIKQRIFAIFPRISGGKSYTNEFAFFRIIAITLAINNNILIKFRMSTSPSQNHLQVKSWYRFHAEYGQRYVDIVRQMLVKLDHLSLHHNHPTFA